MSSRWPKHRRRKDVSHYLHMILASISDEDKRLDGLDNPPLDESAGTYRWTEKAAQQRVEQATREPATVHQ